MRILQDNSIIATYIAESNHWLEREDTDGDGNSVPKIVSFTQGDDNGVIFKSNEFSLTEGGSQILHNGKRLGICPYITGNQTDGYVRDNGVRFKSNKDLEVWVFFENPNNSYDAGWRKIFELDIQSMGDDWNGWLDIPFIDVLTASSIGEMSSNGQGMIGNIAFLTSEDDAEISLISIPDGSAGVYDAIAGSEGTGDYSEFTPFLSDGGERTMLSWRYEDGKGRLNLYHNDIFDYGTEINDKNHLIEEFDPSSFISSIGANLIFPLSCDKPIDHVAVVVKENDTETLYNFQHTLTSNATTNGMSHSIEISNYSAGDVDLSNLKYFKVYINLNYSS